MNPIGLAIANSGAIAITFAGTVLIASALLIRPSNAENSGIMRMRIIKDGIPQPTSEMVGRRRASVLAWWGIVLTAAGALGQVYVTWAPLF
jgi:hypothetical protein